MRVSIVLNKNNFFIVGRECAKHLLFKTEKKTYFSNLRTYMKRYWNLLGLTKKKKKNDLGRQERYMLFHIFITLCILVELKKVKINFVQTYFKTYFCLSSWFMVSSFSMKQYEKMCVVTKWLHKNKPQQIKIKMAAYVRWSREVILNLYSFYFLILNNLKNG